MQNLCQIRQHVHRPVRVRFLIGLQIILLAASLGQLGLATKPVYAHGGVVIDSGYTTEYEWLAAINPYPTTPGPTTITILVYDVQTHQPVNELQAEILLAAPASPTPCCQQGVHNGPLALLTDPAIYPGDYSTIVDLQQVGRWTALVHITAGEQTTTLQFGFDILEGDSNSAVPVATTAVDIAATATAFAANVESARQATSPLPAAVNPAQATSPLTGSENPAQVTSPLISLPNTAVRASAGWLKTNWWLLGIGLLVPVVAVFIWALRPKMEE